MDNYRIGQGVDFHRLVAGRPLVIGGITIPFNKGLDGHSDADVLLHAIMDSLLGAAGLPDIGQHFPPDDDRFRDADSKELMKLVLTQITQLGFEIINIDTTLMAERPKIAGYISKMRVTLASILLIDIKQINIKATTTEKMGFVGREEGMAAIAVCMLRYKNGRSGKD